MLLCLANRQLAGLREQNTRCQNQTKEQLIFVTVTSKSAPLAGLGLIPRI